MTVRYVRTEQAKNPIFKALTAPYFFIHVFTFTQNQKKIHGLILIISQNHFRVGKLSTNHVKCCAKRTCPPYVDAGDNSIAA